MLDGGVDPVTCDAVHASLLIFPDLAKLANQLEHSRSQTRFSGVGETAVTLCRRGRSRYRSDAIQPEPPNQTERFFLLWMAPKRRMERADGQAFKTELLALTGNGDTFFVSEPRVARVGTGSLA